MKAQFLKISGHKNEKDFYKEFPTMESFMAKHGAALRKAQYGDSNNNGIPDYLEGPNAAVNQPDPYAKDQYSGAGPVNNSRNLQSLSGQIKPVGIQSNFKLEATDPTEAIKKGQQQAQAKGFDSGKAISTGIGMVDKVIGGFKALKAEKKALKSARTWRDVSEVSKKASETEDINKRTDIADTAARTRKALMPEVNTEELYPAYGTGTNVLSKMGSKLPTGGLKRSEDYGSKSKPYASVSPGDFAGGGRSYPIPTIQDAGDALRLAGLHHRPDVKAKVYAKYPSLRREDGGYMTPLFTQAQDGGGITGMTNMYAPPDDIYTDGGYEPLGESEMDETGFRPLSDEDIVKSFKSGGLIPKAFFGMSSMMSGIGGGAAGGAGGGMLGGMMGKAGQYFGGSGAGSKGYGGIGAAGNMGESLAGSLTGNNAGSQIGGGFGEAAGSLFGPIGGAIGKTVGTLAGGLLDKNPQKTKKAQEKMTSNVETMSGMSNVKDFRTSNAGVFEDGGYMSWEYPNPRVITHFGEHSMSELLKPDPMMDTLRSGGNLRSNQVGDIRIDPRRGKLEPISFNPYTAGTGMTSMIKGPSHDRGGVNIDYNGNQVEAEGGEPISERQEGGPVGDTSAVITGDQTFNKIGAQLIPELSEYTGKKVKNIQKELAEKDRTLNKLQAKNTKALDRLNPRTPIDKLTFNSLSMNEKGVNEQYKRNALKTQSLISYQDAMNEAAKERGVDAGHLSRGKVMPAQPDMAKTGKTLTKAEAKKAEGQPPAGAKGNVNPNQVYTKPGVLPGSLDQTPIGPENQYPMFKTKEDYEKYKKETEAAYDDPETAKQLVNYFLTYEGPDQEDVRAQMSKQPTYKDMVARAKKLATDYQPGRYHINTGQFKPKTVTPTTTPPPDKKDIFEVEKYKKYGWENLAAQAMPWLRKTPGEPLLGDQLAGEMFALQQHEEPVQARFKRSLLDTPYDISLQDQMNQNQADFNAVAKQVGNNPEALAQLAGQKYGANTNVLGEQFRQNQAMKAGVYSRNRDILNRDLDQNLGIADQQYVRQSTAASNTKAAKQEALNSVAAKIGQNRLENRTLQTYANMFPDFSYNKDFSIRKTGAPTQYNLPVIYNQKGEATHRIIKDDDGNVVDYQPIVSAADAAAAKAADTTAKPADATTSINPAVADKEELEKAKSRYGSLVKAFKNI